MAGELVFITGATGFVGFRVLLVVLQTGYRARISIRRESAIKVIKEHPLIAPYVKSVEFVTVNDITTDGAFDSALDALLILSTLLTEDVEKDIVLPAIHGTTSILNSALKFPSIRRVVITSSVVAVTPQIALMNGDDKNMYTADSRISPLPTPPWGSVIAAYCSSKALALNATDKFMDEKKPHFSIVNIMPGLIVGRNELTTVTEDLLKSTNVFILGPVLGLQVPAAACTVIDVRDVARIHVESLNESKVVGNKNFVLDAGKIKFDDALKIAEQEFPKAIESGVLPLGGHISSVYSVFDTRETVETFGKFYSYSEAAKEVIGQYLELKART